MVDNWFMEDVVKDLNEQKMLYSRSYAELLMAIVLWDNIYYPKNDYNWWNSVPSQVKDSLRPIVDSYESYSSEADAFVCYKVDFQIIL